jgi:uncharacterized phage-associated protein
MRINRDKLLHAIVFFVRNTRACHKVKLYKLLYFLDFEIYRQTGKPATGLLYFAWRMGPVPGQLQDEFRSPPQDMRSALAVFTVPGGDPDSDGPLNITPRVGFDESHFTRRELGVMERLVEIYREAPASTMSEVSHLRGQPWHRIYTVENKPRALIPYTLALDGRPDSVTREQADEIEAEARELAILFE